MTEGPIQIDLDTLAALYGPALYVLQDHTATAPAVQAAPKAETPQAQPQPQAKPQAQAAPEEGISPTPPPQAPGITWRPKPSSQVLFIGHTQELRDPVLGELLKKIVASIGIPFESAGFGLIGGPVDQEEYAAMPNPYGVVFDQDLLPPGSPNPMQVAGLEIFFSHRLAELAEVPQHKQFLWNYLKTLKPKIA